jgi:hypothetical protein
MSEQLYSVSHVTPVTIEVMPGDFVLPNTDEFAREMPLIFNLSGALNHLDYSTMKALRSNGDEFSVLANMVNTQSDKINMLLGFILSQNEEIKNRFFTSSISGSSITFISDLSHNFNVGDIVRIRLYLVDMSLAIYCYGKVLSVKSEGDAGINVEIGYELIRDKDRESLVQATFKIQTMLLKERSEAKCNG